VRARWLALLVMPVACLNPVGPAVEAPSVQPDASGPPVTITTVGKFRYLVHWDGRPRPCPRQPSKMFPIDSLQARDGWYGAQLRAAGEGPLCSDAAAAGEVYRLAWIPSFHSTVVVRIEKRGVWYLLTAVQLSGAGGYAPGIPEHRFTAAISQSDWDEWLGLLSRARFWQAQTIAADTIFDSTGAHVDLMGLDGAQWLLEAARSKEYQAVDRWTPMKDGPYAAFREACTWLLHRTGLVPDTLVAEY